MASAYNNGIGIFVPANDAMAAEDALRWLAANPDDTQRMSDRGRELVAGEYN
jgi:hypothetical protein